MNSVRVILKVFAPLVLIGCAALSLGKTIPKDTISQESMAAFESLEKVMPSPEWIREQEGNSLAWGESYRLMGYVAMLEATGDTRYLDALVQRIDAVLMARDDVSNTTDTIRNRIAPAWSSTKYTEDPYAWIVHAGMITFGKTG